MRESLPADRERALAAIAGGWGRQPTSAHPDCRCNKPKPPVPGIDWTAPDPMGSAKVALAAWQAGHGSTFVSHYGPRDCPAHRPRRALTAPTDEETTDG